MTLGPIEVVVIGFPGSRFTGRILPEIEKLVEARTISLIDGVLIRKPADGVVELVEFDDPNLDEELRPLRAMSAETLYDLVSSDDVDEFAKGLDPDSSAAVLVFEHTWFKPLRDAIVASDGFLAADLRIPGAVVDEVLNSLTTA